MFICVLAAPQQDYFTDLCMYVNVTIGIFLLALTTSLHVAEKVQRLRGGLEQEEHLSKTIKRPPSRV